MNGFSYGGDLGLTLGRMDSANMYQLAVSQSMRMPDIFGLNMSFSVGPSTSRFGLDRQATNMSQMSVGGFRMLKDKGINQNGEVIASMYLESNNPIHGNVHASAGAGSGHATNIDFERELDSMMFNQSINVSKPLDSNQLNASVSEMEKNHNDALNDLISLPCHMTNSQEMDPIQKSAYKSLMGKSRLAEDSIGAGSAAAATAIGLTGMQSNNLLGESSSMINRQASMISMNLTQFQNENYYRYARMNGGSHAGASGNSMSQSLNNNPNQMQASSSFFNQRQANFPICLIDKKMDTRSEPDFDVSHMGQFLEDFPLSQNQQYQKPMQEQKVNMTPSAMQESSSNIGMTIEPFVYSGGEQRQQDFSQQQQQPQQDQQLQESHQQQQHYYQNDNLSYSRQFAHSDDEGTGTTKNVNKRKPGRFMASPSLRPTDCSGATQATASGAGGSQKQKGSQYRQSRHKNVFKNFGGTLVRFIIYNQYFQDRVIKELDKDAQKQQAFHNWLQNNVKLERKKDFQVAWTTFKSDSDTIRQYKALLRELSKDFFENFSFIYLINSKKISDMEIHLRSIHTYLAAINQPDSLERFKPV